jgi:hypothetical protein
MSFPNPNGGTNRVRRTTGGGDAPKEWDVRKAKKTKTASEKFRLEYRARTKAKRDAAAADYVAMIRSSNGKANS